MFSVSVLSTIDSFVFVFLVTRRYVHCRPSVQTSNQSTCRVGSGDSTTTRVHESLLRSCSLQRLSQPPTGAKNPNAGETLLLESATGKVMAKILSQTGSSFEMVTCHGGPYIYISDGGSIRISISVDVPSRLCPFRQIFRPSIGGFRNFGHFDAVETNI